MKSILTPLLMLLCNLIFAQNLDYKNLKEFIGNRVNELEEHYSITASSTEDNFGNLKVVYTAVNINPYILNMEVETEVKNIKRIIVKNLENKTHFFKNIAQEIEQASPVKKNYKTYYISLVKNSTKKKIYQDSIEQLIEVLKNPKTDLTQNYGLLESNALNTTITIDNAESILTIN